MMLSVTCKFNHKYEAFLGEVLNHITTKHKDITLSGIMSIEIVENLPGDSEGRMVDEHSILISARLYNLLPVLDIDKLSDNSEFKLIVNTLCHEIAHINEIRVMPRLHQHVFLREDDLDSMVALFWIEYVVERKSAPAIGVIKNDFCDNVAKGRWNISKLNLDDADCSNFFYLTKCLPYVIARVQANNSMEMYLVTIKNPIVQSMVYELNSETLNLLPLYPFDEISALNHIRELFNKYWDFFVGKSTFISAYPKNN